MIFESSTLLFVSMMTFHSSSYFRVSVAQEGTKYTSSVSTILLSGSTLSTVWQGHPWYRLPRIDESTVCLLAAVHLIPIIDLSTILNDMQYSTVLLYGNSSLQLSCPVLMLRCSHAYL